MAFRLRKDARNWFRALESAISSSAKLFDYYYFCVAVGLAYGEKGDAGNEDTDELIDYYPGEFRTRGRLLTAWLIAQELKALGISLHERSQVYQAIRNLVDPQSPSFLSALGMQQMNRYAAGGFEVLTEKIPEAPRVFPAFLIQFKKVMDAAEGSA